MKERLANIARFVLLAAAAVMITAGILWGEAHIVFTKAIRICLEYIGIG